MGIKFKILVPFMFLSLTTTIAQTVVSGTVMDEKINAPLPGASIIEKGTTNKTISDFDGNFLLKITGESGEIEISYLRYTTITLSFDGDSDLGTISLSTKKKKKKKKKHDKNQHLNKIEKKQDKNRRKLAVLDRFEIRASLR